MLTAAIQLKDALWKKSYDKTRQHIKKQRFCFAEKGLYSHSYGFSCSHVWMWELDHKEAEDRRTDTFQLWCWRRLLSGPLECKEIKLVNPKGNLLNIHWKDWCWNFNTLATHCKELTQKRPWCWERLKAGGDGDNRVWDGWMASPTRWTWVWASSRRWWRTGKPGVLQPIGSQRVGHWVSEQQQRIWLNDLDEKYGSVHLSQHGSQEMRWGENHQQSWLIKKTKPMIIFKSIHEHISELT